MSLLSRNELLIVLAPERIALLSSERHWALRGFQRRVQAREILACEASGAGEAAWSGALASLGRALPRFARRNMVVTVILSNHFVNYVLVPWMEKLSEEEEMVFARHCFREVYGSAADTWSVRISPGPAGVAALASAVDTGMLDELRSLLGRMHLNTGSIQPHLMAAYNSCSHRLAGRSTWMALLEPGNLCLAMLQQGRLVWLRKLRIGGEWHKELPLILERESLLADAEAAVDEVLLWAPQLGVADVPAAGRWKFQHLQPGADSRGQGYGGLYAPAVAA